MFIGAGCEHSAVLLKLHEKFRAIAGVGRPHLKGLATGQISEEILNFLGQPVAIRRVAVIWFPALRP
jgi:hypothetical protein